MPSVRRGSDMMILNYLVRKAGLTREEFEHHWLNVHAPLVRRHAAAIKLRRYVQIHARRGDFMTAIRDPDHVEDAESTHYDGAVELRWDSYEDFLESFQTEAGKAAWAEIAADEPNFADSGSARRFIGEDNLIVG